MIIVVYALYWNLPIRIEVFSVIDFAAAVKQITFSGFLLCRVSVALRVWSLSASYYYYT